VQRVGYALIGAAQRLFEHLDARPGQYTEKDISPYLWHNGKYSDSVEYRLRISGLVDNSVELDLTALRALPHHEQITQHFCIQGWSGIAKWGSASMATVLDLVQPYRLARWVVRSNSASNS
jgi:DMSO/TMAO reductase YedYZ molybdopterin-dependent catalytic subunit